MKAIISRTQNGAWVRFVEPNTEPPELRHRDMSFQFELDANHADKGAAGLVDMLHELLDNMGWHAGKYAKERIVIGLEHGSDYACADNKDCAICQKEDA